MNDEELLQRTIAILERRPGQIITWEQLAGVVDDRPERVEACLREAVARGVRRPPFNNVRRPWFHARGVRWGSIRDRLQFLEEPDPVALEAAALDGRFDEADALMASVGLKPPRLPGGCPGLCWRDDRPLSQGARDWYLRNLLAETSGQTSEGVIAREATLAVDPGLSEASVVAFARWIGQSKLGSSLKVTIPTGREAAVNALGELRGSGELRRQLTQIRGMAGDQRDVNLAVVSVPSPRLPDVRRIGGTLAYLRWAHRLGESLGQVFHNLQPKHWDALVERHWPEGDDPSGTADQWQAEVEAIIDRAIRDGRPMTGARLQRHYLDNPIARRALSGVVLSVDGREVPVEASGAPAEEIGRRREVRFLRRGGQKQRFDLRDLPELPPVMPHGTFLSRCKKLGLKPFPETQGGSLYALLDAGRFRLRVHHQGYGAGYGGRRPVRIIGYDIEVPEETTNCVAGVRGQLATAAEGTAHPGLHPDQSPRRGFEALPAEVLHHVVKILRPLFAEPPPVAASTPMIIRERLASFIEETGAREFRLIFAPTGATEALDRIPEGADRRARLSSFGAIAEALELDGEGLTIAVRDKKSGRNGKVVLWKQVFNDAPSALSGSIDEVVEAVATEPYQVAAGPLFVYDKLGVSVLTEQVSKISEAMKRGLRARVQVDAADTEALELSGELPPTKLKKQLIQFTREAKGKRFDLRADGEAIAQDLKPKKLQSMATVIRQHLEAGAAVQVGLSDAATPIRAAELRF